MGLEYTSHLGEYAAMHFASGSFAAVSLRVRRKKIARLQTLLLVVGQFIARSDIIVA